MLLYQEYRRQYIWKTTVLVATCYLAAWLPLQLCFVLADQPALVICYWLATAILIADLLVNLRHLQRNQSQDIGPRGRQTSAWLLIDLIGAIPFGAIFGVGWIQLLRLVKLARVAQFVRQLRQTEVQYSVTLMLLAFLFWVALLIHLLATGWISVFETDPTANNTTNYISALYWTVTTMTAVGYGDIVPLTNAQRLYAILVQLSGIGVFGYLIGNVVSIVTRTDAVQRRHREHVELLTTAVKRRGLSRDLQRRILDYYAYLRDTQTGYDESAFLKTLPASLRTQVALHLKKEFIEGIPLFRDASERFVADIALKLELIVATPGDYIFKAGQRGDTMFFIISGEVEVWNPDEDQLLTALSEGDYFGEIALFRHEPRTATVRASTYCNLYMLKQSTFESVRADHPEIAAEILATATARERQDAGRS